MTTILTARTYTHSLTREAFPLVEITTAGGCDSPQDGDVVEIEGRPYYYGSDPAAEMDGLFAEAVGEDYGGNVVNGPRTPPTPLTGIAAGPRGRPLRVGFRGQAYFARVRLAR